MDGNRPNRRRSNHVGADRDLLRVASAGLSVLRDVAGCPARLRGVVGIDRVPRIRCGANVAGRIRSENFIPLAQHSLLLHARGGCRRGPARVDQFLPRAAWRCLEVRETFPSIDGRLQCHRRRNYRRTDRCLFRSEMRQRIPRGL
jgi:hypothetical protein